MTRRSGVSTMVGVLAALGGWSCGDSTGPSPLAGFISQVTAGGLQATLVRGDAPAAGGFQGVQLFAPATMIEGGSAEVQLAASGTLFTRVYVYVQGTPDHYEVTLPAAVTSIVLIVTLSQDIPLSQLTLTYGLGTSDGQSYASQVTNVLQVGTGDVQVSVSWDVNSDVDLHVVEPGSEEIYWENPTSASGGELDLDSNPACLIDGVRNENITWPASTPPSGQYTVRLDYYDECGESETRYVVTVRRKGHPTQTFTGSFTGAGDAGGAGSGVLTTQFTY